MFLIVVFCIFVVFATVDLTPQRSRQSPLDPTKELLYTAVVNSFTKLFNYKTYDNQITRLSV